MRNWRVTVRTSLKQECKPLDYVDNLSKPEHIVMLYEDLAYAKCVIFRFLKNGLAKDQHCILSTHDDKKVVRKELERFGIDLPQFERRGLLNILRIRDPTEHPKGLEAGIEEIIERFLSTGISSPYRIAGAYGSVVRDLCAAEGFSAEVQIEEMWSKAFKGSAEGFGQFGEGLVLCPYPLEGIAPRSRWDWLEGNALAFHDAMIYIPQQFGTGVASRV